MTTDCTFLWLWIYFLSLRGSCSRIMGWLSLPGVFGVFDRRLDVIHHSQYHVRDCVESEHRPRPPLVLFSPCFLKRLFWEMLEPSLHGWLQSEGSHQRVYCPQSRLKCERMISGTQWLFRRWIWGRQWGVPSVLGYQLFALSKVTTFTAMRSTEKWAWSWGT